MRQSVFCSALALSAVMPATPVLAQDNKQVRTGLGDIATVETVVKLRAGIGTGTPFERRVARYASVR